GAQCRRHVLSSSASPGAASPRCGPFFSELRGELMLGSSQCCEDDPAELRPAPTGKDARQKGAKRQLSAPPNDMTPSQGLWAVSHAALLVAFAGRKATCPKS